MENSMGRGRMKLQLCFAFKDISKKLVSVILFILQLIISILYFCVAVEELTFSYNGIREVKNIEKYNITYFQPSLGQSGSSYSGAVDNMLEQLWDRDEVGYSIIESMKLDSNPNDKVVVGIGKAFGKVFGLTSYLDEHSDTDTFVFIGANVSHIKVGDFISFGTVKHEKYEVIGRLPSKTNYMIRTSIRDLDQSIVILTSKERMKELHGYYYLDELIGNSVLINPDKSTLINYISVLGNNGIELSPINFNAQAFHHYNNIFTQALLLFVFYLITSIFVFINIVVNVLQLVKRNMREYSIHLLYGASNKHIYLRIILYILMIITIPIYAVFYFLSYIGRIENISFLWVTLLIVGSALLIAWLPIKQIKSENLVEVMGRKE